MGIGVFDSDLVEANEVELRDGDARVFWIDDAGEEVINEGGGVVQKRFF